MGAPRVCFRGGHRFPRQSRVNPNGSGAVASLGRRDMCSVSRLHQAFPLDPILIFRVPLFQTPCEVGESVCCVVQPLSG